MNKQVAAALKPGQRVRWNCGNLRLAGRVLDIDSARRNLTAAYSQIVR